jgi:chitodextrinase
MQHFATLSRALFLLFWCCCSVSWGQQNVIQTENAKPGTSSWRLTAPSDTPTVEGYASHTSVNRGETIRFFVSSAAPTYTLSIYRMGWYGGQGARLMNTVTLAGVKQPTPQPDPVTGLIECNWPESLRITIPNTADKTDWASGIYLVKLSPNTASAPSAGTESHIIFVVRDDSSRATYLYQSTATTSQAYNNWGGKSLYTFNSVGGPARKVSFNRPYARSGFFGGSGNFLNWEVYMVNFLEREGYDVSYVANLDLHTNGGQLLNHRAFLVAGHDEYWSYQMKSAAHAAQAQGVHFGFFTANEAYWQVRFEPSSTGEPNRTMVGYKEGAQSQDPLALDADPANNKFITARFRDLKPIFGVTDSVAQPENGLVGVMYHGDPFNGDMVVSEATNWVYRGSGVINSTRFVGLLGYETDAIADNGFSPPQLRKIADSPDTFGGSHMATYTTPAGSIVFATGTVQWSWGLDNYSFRNLESEAVKQATRNVLARFAAAPLATPGNVQAAAAAQAINLNWTPPAGATSFNIYRSQAPASQGTTPYRTGLSASSFSDTALPASGTSASATYYYVVTAANSATESAQSAEVSATVGTQPPPPACSFPNWVSGTQYAAGAIVTFTDGKFYRAKFANPGYIPTVSTFYWEPFVCPAAPPPPQACSFPSWVSGTQYAAGSIVTFTDGKFYRAKFANPGYIPTVSTFFWEPYVCPASPPPPPPPQACSFPAWVSGRQYAAGAIVSYTDGNLYRAKFANPGYIPTVSTFYWERYTC